MQFRQMSLLLPGDSLADVSPHLPEEDAANLLAVWTTLWHPELLAGAGRLPACKSLDTLAAEAPDPAELVLAPAVSKTTEVATWQAEHPLAPAADGFGRRSEVIAQVEAVLAVKLTRDASVVADFYALGFAYLQIEMLTRSMHYDPLVDQQALTTAVVSAARAVLAGDRAAFQSHLDDAYDYLLQCRNHYYPIDYYLIDLALVAPATTGDALGQLATSVSAGNVLVHGDTLRHLHRQVPDALAAVRSAVEARRLTVCGGSTTDRPLASLGPEALLDELREGQVIAKETLGRHLSVFAHFAGPFAPLVPGMLNKLGYYGALTSNFVGGRLPRTTNARTTWTGLDGTAIEALNAVPIDVGSSAALLGLASKAQHTMNYDLAASLLLAGWPGHRCEAYGDLMQIASRSALLGRPMTLEEYFDVTTSADYAGTLAADAYPAASGPTVVGTSTEPGDRFAALAHVAAPGAESRGDGPARLAAILGGADEGTATGTLWLNASSVERRDGRGVLPGFGWCFEPHADRAEHPPRAEPGVLRNEQMEVVFDPMTGGISATRLHAHRGNHLSQQLVLLATDARGVVDELQLAFDGWEVTEATDNGGALASDFRVVDRQGSTVAEARQSTTLAEHSDRIDMSIDLVQRGNEFAGWKLVSRIAVRDEDFSLTRGLQGVDLPTERRRISAEWLGISGAAVPVAVLCDRPREHRRHTGRMLDTAVASASSQPTTARLSYVLGRRHPAQAMATLREPQYTVGLEVRTEVPAAGWWVHLGAKGLHVTHLRVDRLEGRLRVIMRILETSGRAVRTSLTAWRPLVEARLINFLGEQDQPLTVREGKVELQLAAYEFVELVTLMEA